VATVGSHPADPVAKDCVTDLVGKIWRRWAVELSRRMGRNVPTGPGATAISFTEIAGQLSKEHYF